MALFFEPELNTLEQLRQKKQFLSKPKGGTNCITFAG